MSAIDADAEALYLAREAAWDRLFAAQAAMVAASRSYHAARTWSESGERSAAVEVARVELAAAREACHAACEAFNAAKEG